jgi:hypothetical protein
MKQNRVSQKERERILQMYGSKYLNEETSGNKTIQDIQRLLGPQTLTAIQAKLGQPDKSTTPSVDGLTYKDLIDAGWTDEQIGKSKYKSLLPKEGLQGTEPKTGEVLKVKRDATQAPEPIKMGTMTAKSITTAPTPSGLQVGVERTGGEQTKVAGTDDKQVIQSADV